MVENKDLFFVDTKGQIDSRKNRKRRGLGKQKDDSEDEANPQVNKKQKKKQPKKQSVQQTPTTNDNDNDDSDSKPELPEEMELDMGRDAVRTRKRRREKAIKKRSAEGRIFDEQERSIAECVERQRMKDQELADNATEKDMLRHFKPGSKLSKKRKKGQLAEFQRKRHAKKNQDTGLDIWGADTSSSNKQRPQKKKASLFKREMIRPTKEVEYNKAALRKGGLSVVHAGASVNPDKQQHQEAMRAIHDTIVTDQKEREILSLKLRGLYDDGKKEELPEFDHDAPVEPRSVASRIVEIKTKNKAERNRLARKKAKEQEMVQTQKLKAMNRQLHDLKKIKMEIDEEEKTRVAEKEKIAGLKEENPEYREKRLGKFMRKEELPEVLLTEEIAEEGNLRKTRPSLRVVKDQFKRFQEKRLIEPREKNRYRRRYGLKYYNRHKDGVY